MSSQKWRNSCPVDMCNKVWFSHKSTKAIRVQCMQKGRPWSYLSVWKILVQAELFYKSSYRLHCDMVTHTAQLQVTCCTITAFARSHCISNVDHNSPERYKANTMEIQQGNPMNQSADLTSPAFLQAEASRHSPYLSNGSPSLAAWDIDIFQSSTFSWVLSGDQWVADLSTTSSGLTIDKLLGSWVSGDHWVADLSTMISSIIIDKFLSVE